MNFEERLDAAQRLIGGAQSLISSLREEMKKVKAEKKLTFEDIYPMPDENAYFISDTGKVERISREYYRFQALHAARNLFHKKEDAEKLKNLSPLQREWAIILRHLHGGEWWIPDWANNAQIKYIPSLSNNYVSVVDASYTQTLYDILYAESEEICRRAIEIMGEDRVIKMIKGEG